MKLGVTTGAADAASDADCPWANWEPWAYFFPLRAYILKSLLNSLSGQVRFELLLIKEWAEATIKVTDSCL